MMSGTRNKTEYWQDNIDKRKMAIQFVNHIWMVIIGILAGIIIGAVSYLIYHAIADQVSYQGYSEFYLDFATDEKGDAYQWYNGYTWTGLMSAEPIVSNTLAELDGTGVDVTRIEQDTVAEIKSDIRVLRVTFTDSDAELCQKLQTATEKSLVTLGSSVKEFNSIELIKSVAPERVRIDNRMFQAIELGAIAGLIISLIVMWFAYILDDSVMTIADLESLGEPIIGVKMKRNGDAISRLMSSMYQTSIPESVYRLDMSRIGENTDDKLIDEASQAAVVILDIPYRKASKSLCRLVIYSLRDRQVTIAGMCITDADNNFYRAYYSLDKKKN